MKGTPEYEAWAGMKARCTNPNRGRWKDYGGRGIGVCEHWLNSPGNFLKDMGEKPEPKRAYSIDRIDNDKGYLCGKCSAGVRQCRWATREEQARNRRGNQGASSQYKGVWLDKDTGKWKVEIMTDGHSDHLGYYAVEEDAARAYDVAALAAWGPNGLAFSGFTGVRGSGVRFAG
jgi:AP2 domain